MVAVLAQTTLVPELQHWMNRFILKQKINKFREPPPSDIDVLYLTRTSFIEMLFNDDYALDSYEWKWKIETHFECIPRAAVRRLQVYPTSYKYLVMDETEGDNVFNLQTDDFTMLDALLAYRTDETSVTIIDSTATTVFDSTSNILIGGLSSLTTELSQLIWLYLDLEIRGNSDAYNSDTPISTGGFIETCYEQYVVNKFFIFLSNREPDLIDGGVC